MSHVGLPLDIIAGILINLIVGAVVFLFGGAWAKKGATVCQGSLFISAVLILSRFLPISAPFIPQQPEGYFRGWIGSTFAERGAQIGFQVDSVALLGVFVSIIIAAAHSLSKVGHLQDSRAERFHAASVIAAAGASLSWISVTPWLCFVGISFVILSGFLARGSEWNTSTAGANRAVKEFSESFVGLLLAVIGACMLSGLGVGERFGGVVDVPAASIFVGAQWGAGVLLLGAYWVFRPFPLMGWAVQESKAPFLPRFLMGQVILGWAVWPLIARLEPLARALHLFPQAIWVPIVAAVLAFFSAFFQEDWKRSLQLWVIGLFSVSLLALIAVGPNPAFSLALGAVMGPLVLALAGVSIEANPPAQLPKPIGERNAFALKTAVFLAATLAMGGLGWLTSGGTLKFLAAVSQEGEAWPALFGFGFLLFLSGVVAWKLVWTLKDFRPVASTDWGTGVSIVLVLLFSMGWIWTGTLTGGFISAGIDTVMESNLGQWLGGTWMGQAAVAERWEDFENVWATAVAIIIMSFFVAIWMHPRWGALARRFPAASRFFVQAYRVEELLSATGSILAKTVQKLEAQSEQGVWRIFFGSWMVASLQWMSSALVRADVRFARGVDKIVRTTALASSHALQKIQNGRLQWYLLFAFLGSFVLLIHLLKGLL